MSEHTNAKMFLADERGLQEDDNYRSYHTFNFGDYFNEHKIPFSNLYVFNDDTLAGAHSVSTIVKENSYIILLPVVGAIYYKDGLGNENMINAGEMQLVNLPGNETFEVSNPYENEPVNYLQVRIQPGTGSTGTTPIISRFNLLENKNRLVAVKKSPGTAALHPNCSIGQFDGREEACYQITNRHHGLFVFVVEGAFEVQGRLLHPRDALALWDVPDRVELEALSNEAIIFLLEVP